LDDDGSGSIGWQELKEPLIGLGLTDSVEQILQMIELVDEDRSGLIEFQEFLQIIRNGGK
jgi:centrin-1